MPKTYSVTFPDGHTLDFQGPAGMSATDVEQRATQERGFKEGTIKTGGYGQGLMQGMGEQKGKFAALGGLLGGLVGQPSLGAMGGTAVSDALLKAGGSDQAPSSILDAAKDVATTGATAAAGGALLKGVGALPNILRAVAPTATKVGNLTPYTMPQALFRAGAHVAGRVLPTVADAAERGIASVRGVAGTPIEVDAPQMLGGPGFGIRTGADAVGRIGTPGLSRPPARYTASGVAPRAVPEDLSSLAPSPSLPGLKQAATDQDLGAGVDLSPQAARWNTGYPGPTPEANAALSRRLPNPPPTYGRGGPDLLTTDSPVRGFSYEGGIQPRTLGTPQAPMSNDVSDALSAQVRGARTTPQTVVPSQPANYVAPEQQARLDNIARLKASVQDVADQLPGGRRTPMPAGPDPNAAFTMPDDTQAQFLRMMQDKGGLSDADAAPVIADRVAESAARAARLEALKQAGSAYGVSP